MESEGLSEDEVIKKKSYVVICNLDADDKNIKFADLASMLNIAVDEVEEWAIEAIARNIIDAKID